MQATTAEDFCNVVSDFYQTQANMQNQDEFMCVDETVSRPVRQKSDFSSDEEAHQPIQVHIPHK